MTHFHLELNDGDTIVGAVQRIFRWRTHTPLASIRLPLALVVYFCYIAKGAATEPVTQPVPGGSLTELLFNKSKNTQYEAAAGDLPTLAQISKADGKDGMLSLSGCCHILLFYGLESTDLPSFKSGALALKAMTDEQEAISTFGKSPFIRTRNGLRYVLSNDPIFHTDVGESHRDQCLATFGALGLPLNTPINLKSGRFTLSGLLSEAIANFTFEQREIAWTAIAFAKYLPPIPAWTNRFLESTSFTELTAYLLRRDFNAESCAGTHIFQALVQIEKADRRHSVLDEITRLQLTNHLSSLIQDAGRQQKEDGSWGKRWCRSIHNDEVAPMTPLQSGILITGHLLEILLVLEPLQRPPDTVYARAAEWLAKSLRSKDIASDGSWICPFTHAARSARSVRGRSQKGTQSDAVFHLPSGEVGFEVQKQQTRN